MQSILPRPYTEEDEEEEMIEKEVAAKVIKRF